MDITVFEAAKFLSFTVNGVFAFLWGKKKVVLNHYLSGQWKGSLIDQNDKNFIIDCTLYLDYQKNACTGSLIYETKHNCKITARGVDRLLHYDDRELMPVKWSPTFERVFHLIDETNQVFKNNVIYQFSCEIKNRWFKNSMSVEMEGENMKLKGKWHRQ